MPDDQNNYNPMQANLGLIPNQGPIGMPTPSPADTALRLTEQANAQLEHARSMTAAASAFGEQFRQQFQMIQRQQSMSPYAAQMLAQNMPGTPQYRGGMLPSPLTMTPATTGVFRPPPQAPTFAPVPPMYVPRFDTPITPRMPRPMFRSPYEQEMEAQDVRADRWAAGGAQIPNFAAQAATIAGGAWAGRHLMGRMGLGGRWGGLAGLALGAAGTMAAGIPEAVGNIANFAMRPFRERQEMGAAMQRMSRDWVVTGPQLHPLGRGLTREAAVEFGGAVRNLAGDQGFQQQTGEMFNRQDLMNITRQGGRAGLFDMAQSVPQIQNQLRQTAITIRQFMELTNDPDVSNVIRQMGQLRQFGMTQQEMLTAAQGMRTFARAAGTTIGGIQQIGGLPGAMTFQQAGLTPGTGFQYGNFAAASARQLVAAGGVNPRQLALLGGVQGIAQRDIQAQAALGSMPLYGAAMAQYGPQGWGVNTGAVGQRGGGAFGMVQGAIGAMNQAMQQGGLGALASFPLSQREIQDEALSRMTPQQQMAQRFQMAMTTGQQLGLRGRGGFAAGARILFGDEVATQMMHQAESPGFWRGQRQIIQRQQQELAFQQRQQMLAAAPFLGGIPRDIAAATGITGAARGIGRAFEDMREGIGEAGAAVGGVVGEIGGLYREWEAGQRGVMRRELTSGAGGPAAGVRARAEGGGNFRDLVKAQQRGEFWSDKGAQSLDTSAQALMNAVNLKERGVPGAVAAMGGPFEILGTTMPETGAMISSYARYTADEQEKRNVLRGYITEASRTLNIIDESKVIGGREENVAKVETAIEKALGSKSGIKGYDVIRAAGRKLDEMVYNRGKYGENITQADRHRAIIEGIMEASGGKVDIKRARQLAAKIGSQPHLLHDMEVQVTHYARQDALDPSLYVGQEEDHRASVFKQITKATNQRVESLQNQIETMEEKLDLDPFMGYYSEEEEKIQKLAAGWGGKGTAIRAMALLAETGDMTAEERRANQKKWRAVADKYKLTSKERRDAENEARQFAAKNTDIADRLREAAKAGTVQQLERYGITQQEIGIQSAFSSKGFMGEFAPYSEKLPGFMATATEPGAVSARSIAQQFTDPELAEMARTGGAKGRRWAAIFRKAKGTGEEATKAQELITREAARQSEISEKGVEEAAAMTSEERIEKWQGGKGKGLAASDRAMADMQAVFSEFGTAVQVFAQGSQRLQQAMNSEMANNLAKGGT